MSENTPSTKERLLPEISFGIAIMRGILALGIGLLLFFFPEKNTNILVNTMGFFWLVTGIALLRRSKGDPVVQMVGSRGIRVIAVVGAVAGLLVVTRGLARQIVPEGTYLVLLGAVILLTGLVHLTANVRFGGATSSQHRWLSILLGILEVSLGLTLIVSPLDRSPATYWIATIWALVFGFMVIIEAVTKRSETRNDVAVTPVAGVAVPEANTRESI